MLVKKSLSAKKKPNNKYLRVHQWLIYPGLQRRLFQAASAKLSDANKLKRKFSSFFKSLVIELDKELYGPDNHLVEVWINSKYLNSLK